MFGGDSNNTSAPATDAGQQAAEDSAVMPSAVPPAMPASEPSYGMNDQTASDADTPSSESTESVEDTAPADDAAAQPSGMEELLELKQKALQQLSPLVSHLDQTPEEKFRTTMMMIQAADNKDLLSEAYAAAEQITDEKVKAQALLDVVNEINYFTQNHDE